MDILRLLSTTCLLFWSRLFVLPGFCQAQSSTAETFSQFEIGGQVSLFAMNRVATSTADFGVGGRFSVNFSPRLSWLSQVNYFPEHHVPSSQDGGTTLTFYSGFRSRVVKTHGLALFEEVQPGL